MDNYWAPFHIVSAYNLIHDNYGQQGLYAGKNTDGNGIIYDTFRSYAGQSLCLGNIVYHNGGKGIHVFKSGHVTVANNTAYNNNWDTYNPGTWRAEISAHDSVGSTFINNIAWTTRGTGVTSTNAPFMAHSGRQTPGRTTSLSAHPTTSQTPTPIQVRRTRPTWIRFWWMWPRTTSLSNPAAPPSGSGPCSPYLPPQCIDVGACPSACTTCPYTSD